jgi:hypothetical protein
MNTNNVIVHFHQALIITSSYTSGFVICLQSKPFFGYLNMGPFFGPYKTHLWFLLKPSSKKYWISDGDPTYFFKYRNQVLVCDQP